MAAAERGPLPGGLAGGALDRAELASMTEAMTLLQRLAAVPLAPTVPAAPAAPAPPAGGAPPGPGLADARYQALVEQIPAVVFLASVEGSLSDIYVSPQIEALLGFTQKEWSGNPVLWYRQLHADDRGRLSREFAKTCITGEPFRGIVRVWSRDGALVWVHAEARLVRDGAGRPLFLHGVAFDITEQQRAAEMRQELLLAQQARAEADREQRAAAEASRRASFVAAVSRALGARLDDPSVPREVARLMVPELADLAAVEAVAADGSIQLQALAHREPAALPSATCLWELYPLPLQAAAPAGTPAGDPAPRLVPRAEEAALAAVARDAAHLELLRQLAPASYMEVPIRSAGRLHGMLTLVRLGAGAAGLAGGGGGADGALAARSYGPDDLLLAEDVAQRTAMALDNARLYREVQEASRLKDEFLATLSHELRTPLNAIIGWAELLRDGGVADAAEVRRAVEIIVRNANAQNELISDILDVSRIIAGKLALKLEVVEVAAVIAAAMDTVRLAAGAKEIELRVVLPSIGAGGAGTVLGDPDRLRQVVWNLLANAIKFAPRGGHVEVRVRQAAASVELVVEDDGPGISPEFLPHIFERFRQADSSTTRRHGGLGLGLAIVRHLVELHGGTVEAANRAAASGATFRLCLPRCDRSAGRHPEAGPPPPEEAAHGMAVAAPLSGIRVLVVDNEPDALQLMAEVLRRAGAHVRTALSAAAAFDLHQSERFDVLLCDIEMPDEDGYSLIRRIRGLPWQSGGAIPAAAITAYATSRDSLRSREAGFHLHLPKPIQAARLLGAVASLAAAPRPAAGE